jgi:hemerythrin superfamily protein
MDAIALLKSDHREVEQLFKKFEGFGPRALKGKQSVVEKIIRELSMHASLEEVVLYPAAREVFSDKGPKEADSLVLEALEEHHIVKWTLSELDGMDPSNERYDAKMAVLMESVRHHVKEEEKEFFPQLRTALSKARLTELGQMMEEMKKTAPTRPHPRMPDEPPGNLAAAAGGAVADRLRDAGRKSLRKAVAKRPTGVGIVGGSARPNTRRRAS